MRESAKKCIWSTQGCRFWALGSPRRHPAYSKNQVLGTSGQNVKVQIKTPAKKEQLRRRVPFAKWKGYSGERPEVPKTCSHVRSRSFGTYVFSDFLELCAARHAERVPLVDGRAASRARGTLDRSRRRGGSRGCRSQSSLYLSHGLAASRTE